MAAGATYEPIATTTLGSANSTITFSSIAASWTDLRLVLVFTPSSGQDCILRFNSDSASNYSQTTLYGNGTTAGSGRQTAQTSIDLTGTSGGPSTTIPQMFTYDIFSYAGSTTNKTLLGVVTMDQNGSGNTNNVVGLWRSTAAITRIDLTLLSSANFNTGTTATLYGIKNSL
jgi:hypothetical protein